jgi:5-methylcytosine-specific restriction protein A
VSEALALVAARAWWERRARSRRRRELLLREAANGGRGGRDAVTKRWRCRWCGRPIEHPRRQSYCDDACAHEFKLRNEPAYFRLAVFARDRGACARCWTDTLAAAGHPSALGLPHPERLGVHGRSLLRASALGDWQADHVVEVADGGGGGLDNAQTLCVECHAAKTAASRRARQRSSA